VLIALIDGSVGATVDRIGVESAVVGRDVSGGANGPVGSEHDALLLLTSAPL
jgi:hypothetical protein